VSRTSILFAMAIVAMVSQLVGADDTVGLNPGDKAPEFNLQNQEGKDVKLSELLKKGNVALVFYRSADW
jgi:hypothetical protein